MTPAPDAKQTFIGVVSDSPSLRIKQESEYDWNVSGATNSDMPWEPPAKKRRGKKRGHNAGAFGKGGRK